MHFAIILLAVFVASSLERARVATRVADRFERLEFDRRADLGSVGETDADYSDEVTE